MIDAEQIALFCSALLGGPDGDGDDRLEDLRVHLWTIDPTQTTRRTQWGRADKPHALVSAACALGLRQPDEIAHVYLGTGLVHKDEPSVGKAHKRATNDSVCGLFALCVDIDFRGQAHDRKAYPPDLAAARRIWEAVPLRPTMVVHTGNGVHVWWALTEPWLIGIDEDTRTARDAMYELTQAWSATLRYHAHRLGGWQIDSTYDLARLMRVPGTLNVKPEGTTEARILEINPGNRYEPDDFREWLVEPEVLGAYTNTVPGLTVAELPGVDLARVWARVTSAAYRESHYTPPWLADMLEIMPGSPLEGVWEGHVTTSGDTSASGVDASLIRLLIEANREWMTPERLVEAIMCRRLRTGADLDKVNPHVRTSYLVQTVARIQIFAEESHKQRQEADAAAERIRAHVEASPVTLPPAEREWTAEHDVADVALDEIDAMPLVDPLDGVAFPAVDHHEDVPPPPDPGPEPEREDDAPPSAAEVRDEPVETAPVSPPRLRPVSYWSERHPEAVIAMDSLTELLIDQRRRDAGVKVWSLEYRDQGEAQQGRMVLRIPENYDWKGNVPPTFRPGRPFYCDWIRRGSFSTFKGFRRSLMQDALIPARAPKTKQEKDTWEELIETMLVPHWQRDSSGSDMMAQTHAWFYNFLVGHPATTEQAVAVENRRSYLLDHADWGRKGEPVLMVAESSFFDYLVGQPGAPSGRNAKVLLGNLNVEQGMRPRWTGPDGKSKRMSNWMLVNYEEFDRIEWDDILEVAREAHAAARRRLSLVRDSSA